ncbi:MAG: metallophosphoesterase [Steroidobacteraceae bacterium]
MSATQVAVIGDTHFGRVDAGALEALLNDLRESPPSLVIVAGDLTQRARRSEFRAARDFLKALPSPALAIPGNHDLPLFDLPRRLLHPYGRFRHYISAELEPTALLPEAAVFGADATRRLRHKDGVFDRRQIGRIADRLRQADRPFRVVVAHQPLAALHADDAHNVADGSDRALKHWLAAGADLFVGGHVHRGYCLAVGRERRGIVVQAGTAVSTRRRHGLPNSYYRIELELSDDGSRRMRILRRDHDPARGQFATRGHEQAIATEPGGWRISSGDAVN